MSTCFVEVLSYMYICVIMCKVRPGLSDVNCFLKLSEINWVQSCNSVKECHEGVLYE